jgi:hypothetical protein
MAQNTTNVQIEVEGYIRVPISTSVTIAITHPDFETWLADNEVAGMSRDELRFEWEEEMRELAQSTFDINQEEILEEAYWADEKKGYDWATGTYEFDEAQGEVAEDSFQWDTD